MVKRNLLLTILLTITYSTFVYAASAWSSQTITIPEEEIDVYGNEKGYQYYSDYADMPQNITYNKKDKNNNPDSKLMISFTPPNVSAATYSLNSSTGSIKCDGTTYILSKKNADGNYERVTINGRAYNLTDGLILGSANSDYYYDGKAYDIDSVGNFYAFKHQWVENTIYNDVYGEWKETNELLFKYEIPFNTLWKNRPLSEEEMEDYLNGPGYNLNPIENLGQYGNVNIIGPNRKIEVSEDENVIEGKPKPLNDTLNPMNAVSTTKKKK